MKTGDRNRFLRAMEKLFTLHDRQPSEALIEIYWAALSTLPIESVEMAIGKALYELKFFPKPVELREFACGPAATPEELASLAWDKVQQALSRTGGTYTDVIFDDPAIHLALVSMGGWSNFGQRPEKDEPFTRKEFEKLHRIHQGVIARGESASIPAVLVGMHGGSPRPNLIGEPRLIDAWRQELLGIPAKFVPLKAIGGAP